MNFNPEIHHRRSVRLKGYDYSQTGAYFVTICVKDRVCLFGDVVYDKMALNEAGCMVSKSWYELTKKFSAIETDEFVVMPNHIHGIIVFNDICRGGDTPPLRRHALGQIVAYFKYQSAKEINRMRNTPGYPLWQRNYYEHIIRDDRELHTIREYIRYNSLKWEEDEENPNIKRAI